MSTDDSTYNGGQNFLSTTDIPLTCAVKEPLGTNTSLHMLTCVNQIVSIIIIIIIII
jgi:hypothetical protein